MNTQAMKEILSAYRPGTEDDNDPLIQKALEAVAHDPELERFLDHQLQMDIQIRDALKEEPAPDGLYDDILEFGKEAEKTGNPRRWLKFVSYGMGIAACLTVGLGFFAKDTIINNQILGYHPQFSSMERVDGFREAMSMFVNDTFINLDQLSEDTNQLNHWLAENGSPEFGELPFDLAALDGLGCKKLIWKGHKVSLVCFHLDGDQIVHLFILDNIQDVDPDGSKIKALERHFDLESKGWVDSQSGKSYIMVGSSPKVELSRIRMI